MTDEAKLMRQAERGDRAQRILDDELVQEAFASVEETIRKGWQETPGDAIQARENAYLMHRLLVQFKTHFATLVRTGEMAQSELLMIRDPSKLKRMIQRG